MEMAIVIVTGAFTLITAVVAGIIEKRTRRDDEKWIQNTREHEALVSRLEDIGSSLGRSIDRVEINLSTAIDVLGRRVEQVDEIMVSHIEDHARGVFSGKN
jgi:hypothetical protein